MYLRRRPSLLKNTHTLAEAARRREMLGADRHFTNDMANELRRKLARDYDESEEIQKRWKGIFQAVRRRRSMADGEGCDDEALVPTEPHEELFLWADAVAEPDRDRYTHLPMHPNLMTQHYQKMFGSMRNLATAANDDSAYTLDPDVVKNRLDGFAWTGGHIFGCGAGPHNVCTHTFPVDHLQTFARLMAALSRVVDGFKKTIGNELHIFCVSQAGPAAAELHTFIALGHASFNPKFQTYCRASPLDDAACAASGFRREPLAPFPWKLILLTRPSPLCTPSVPKYMELFHETSDELCQRLVHEVADASWSIRELTYDEIADTDLLQVRITGWKSEAAQLEVPQRRHVLVPDAFVAWRRRMSATRGGPSAATPARPPRREPSAAAPSRPPRSEPSDVAPPPIADWVFGDDDDDAFYNDGLGAPGGAPEALGDAIADVLDDTIAAAADPEVPDIEGDNEPAATSSSGEHGMAAVAAADVFAEALEVLGRTAAPSVAEPPLAREGGGHSNAACSSSPAPAPGVAPPGEASGAVVIYDGPEVRFEMSEKGYVRACGPPHDGRLFGRITFWGNNISARCSLHSGCSCAKAQSRFSHRDMMAWLAKGQPVPSGASQEDRAALKAAHLKARPR